MRWPAGSLPWARLEVRLEVRLEARAKVRLRARPRRLVVRHPVVPLRPRMVRHPVVRPRPRMVWSVHLTRP